MTLHKSFKVSPDLPNSLAQILPKLASYIFQGYYLDKNKDELDVPIVMYSQVMSPLGTIF